MRTRRSVCSTICVHISAGIFHGISYLKKNNSKFKQQTKMIFFTGNESSISKRIFACGTGIKPSACVTLNFERLSARSSSRNHTLGITVHK
jgi:hypothetical protein